VFGSGTPSLPVLLLLMLLRRASAVADACVKHICRRVCSCARALCAFVRAATLFFDTSALPVQPCTAAAVCDDTLSHVADARTGALSFMLAQKHQCTRTPNVHAQAQDTGGLTRAARSMHAHTRMHAHCACAQTLPRCRTHARCMRACTLAINTAPSPVRTHSKHARTHTRTARTCTEQPSFDMHARMPHACVRMLKVCHDSRASCAHTA
jgi:hypothetical protein